MHCFEGSKTALPRPTGILSRWIEEKVVEFAGVKFSPRVDRLVSCHHIKLTAPETSIALVSNSFHRLFCSVTPCSVTYQPPSLCLQAACRRLTKLSPLKKKASAPTMMTCHFLAKWFESAVELLRNLVGKHPLVPFLPHPSLVELLYALVPLLQNLCYAALLLAPSPMTPSVGLRSVVRISRFVKCRLPRPCHKMLLIKRLWEIHWIKCTERASANWLPPCDTRIWRAMLSSASAPSTLIVPAVEVWQALLFLGNKNFSSLLAAMNWNSADAKCCKLWFTTPNTRHQTTPQWKHRRFSTSSSRTPTRTKH